MADAKLTIDIQDGTESGGKAPPASGAVDADLLDRWKRLTDAMAKATDDVAARVSRRMSGAPVAVPPAGTATAAAPSRSVPPAGRAWAQLDYDARRRAALSGRPADVSDSEWVAFGRENARRGMEAARVSGRATAEAARHSAEVQRKEQARAKESAAAPSAGSSAGGAAAAGVAATAIRGGGIGQAAGSAAGAAIGGRLGGQAGAVVGSAVGEKAGAVVDNPLGGAASFSKKVAAGDGVAALESASDAAAIALAVTVPGAGVMAAAALKTFSSTVGATTETMNAFAARAKEIGMFSGQITGAAARQDVTRLMADIKESQRMGDSYAALIDKQTEFEETMRAMLLPIKEHIVKYLPMMMDWMLDFAIWSIESLDKVLIGDYGLKAIAGEMRKARDDARRGASAEFDIEAMFRADRGRPIVFPAPLPPGGPGGPGGLDIPLIPPRP